MIRALFSWVSQHTWHTGMLWGLVFIAVPIIIWLFNRFRFKTTEWAAPMRVHCHTRASTGTTRSRNAVITPGRLRNPCAGVSAGRR